MAEKSSFFDAVEIAPEVWDREYNAQEFTDYFKTLVTTGVMKGAGNQLAVTANGSNMVTSVNTGIAFLLGRYYENDASLTFIHDTETLGLNRIDRIVIRMDQNVDARHVKAFLKKGTASTNPVPPALTQNNTVYEISLAQVRITGGQTFIASDAVTDERGTDVICPWAGSNILPSFNDNALSNHIDDNTVHIPYVVAGGVANTYTALINGVNAYVEGMALSVKIPVQNIGASTININGLGAKSILKGNGNAMASGNLKANSIYTLRYNGVNFIVQGEGGEYGTAIAGDVLAGKTIGTDSGLITGTIVDRRSTTSSGSRAASGSGYIDVLTPGGYYASNSGFVRITDTNFTAANIKSGVSVFGLSGSFTGNIYTATVNHTWTQYGTNQILFERSFSPGFTPQMIIIFPILFNTAIGQGSAFGIATRTYGQPFPDYAGFFSRGTNEDFVLEEDNYTPSTWTSTSVSARFTLLARVNTVPSATLTTLVLII